ncbi:MAG: hypothetical protein OEM67_04510 [Thermoleophilia bacterium]|nr:hypothetical protein [Thermoleophilia bacterium]MDH3724566.1 hypothetical protein [Thermoleophilia bacterium]
MSVSKLERTPQEPAHRPRWEYPNPDESARSARAFGMIALGCALIAIVALGSAAILLADRGGTGGGGGISPASAAAPTSAEQDAVLISYRQRANRICESALRVDELLAPTTEGQLSAVVRLSLDASVRPTVNQLSSLVPPERFEAEHASMVAAGQAQIEVLDELIVDLDSGVEPKSAAISAASRLDTLQQQSNRSFEVMGVRKCLAPTGPPAKENNQ